MPILPSKVTGIFVKNKDGKLEQKLYRKEDMSISIQRNINSYYILHGLGDSGAGVIRETTVGGLRDRQDNTRSTILAILTGGKPFKTLVKNEEKTDCHTTVTKLGQNVLAWMKKIDREHYDNGTNIF